MWWTHLSITTKLLFYTYFERWICKVQMLQVILLHKLLQCRKIITLANFRQQNLGSIYKSFISLDYWLVVSTHLKNMSPNGFIFPNFRGENKKMWKNLDYIYYVPNINAVLRTWLDFLTWSDPSGIPYEQSAPEAPTLNTSILRSSPVEV